MLKSYRCAAYTTEGKRCKKRITKGKYCSVHSHNSGVNKIKKVFNNHRRKQISASAFATKLKLLKQKINRKSSFPKN